MKTPNLEPNFEEAKRFLTLLAGWEDAEFTFQTFDDLEERSDDGGVRLQQVFHGRFEEVNERLTLLNKQGAAICVCVNETDLQGRRKENIVRLRAVFVDSDTGDLPQLALQPSMLVQTKRGQHGYWLLSDGEALERFESVQKSLIHHLGTDKTIKDINRAMRLPGFFHMKNPSEPFMVKVTTQIDARYSLERILSVYPPNERSQTQNPNNSRPRETCTGDFRQWAASLPIEESNENRLGGRDKTLHFLICEGLAQNIPADDLRQVAFDYCERSNLPIDEAREMIPRLTEQHGAKPFTSYQDSRTGPFEVTDNGVFHVDYDGKGVKQRTRICSRLDVVAFTRDELNEAWGRLLHWKDRDGLVHEWAMPMEMLKGDGADFRGYLLGRGLEVSPGLKARNHLADYIQSAHPPRKARCVNRIGWHDQSYVLPNRSFGPKVNGECVILQSTADSHSKLRSSGTLEEWQHHIARPCSGNSRLIFSVSVAFAAPLLCLANEESGGFHLRGPSSLGKTTALRVAGSVWGGGGISGFTEKWKATLNGLEAVAHAHCDSILLLDELAELNPREAGSAAYMLANGGGKVRADKTCFARKRAEWRLLFLSSGELSLSDHMNEGGLRATAGQETRMVELPADAGENLGLFGDLHDASDGASFSKLLVDASNKYYGTAAIAFLEHLTADLDNSIRRIKELKNQFLDAVDIRKNASGQVYRVAGRFALVAAAGQLAVEFGILPWSAEQVIASLKSCFKAWLEQRGGDGDLEAESAIRQIRAFLQENPGRFTVLNHQGEGVSTSDDSKLRQAGCRRKVGERQEWWIFPEVFKKELCAGHDPKHVARILKENGKLKADSKGGSTRPERVPGIGKPQTRVYVINDSIMEDSK